MNALTAGAIRHADHASTAALAWVIALAAGAPVVASTLSCRAALAGAAGRVGRRAALTLTR